MKRTFLTAAILAVVVAALLGILFVLDVVPAGEAREVFLKVFAVIGIGAAAFVLITVAVSFGGR